jgi:disulfide bond formation protein DsbB
LPLSKIKAAICNNSFAQIFCLSILPIIIAYISEIFFNLAPCILCVYQRIPYFALIILSIMGIFVSPNKKYTQTITVLIIIALTIEIGLAFYHVGIEHYIFDEEFTCADNLAIGNLLSSKKLAASCSQAAFKFMNFSMAEWNFLYATALLSLFIYQEQKKWNLLTQKLKN